ncbi:MAG TPA: hypothetical protein VFQ27_13290 [Xanthobacteraceae bacterium]|nr:hypothetical protein [Xanthobacteraceae bacterium]
MALPAFLAGDSLVRLVQGTVFGVIGTMLVGFTWGGWTLGSTAEKMAQERATAAVVDVLAPACVQRFQQQPDLAAQWAAFKKVNSWERDSFIVKSGFATPIGSKTANEPAAEKCAELLTDIMEKQAAATTKS